MKIYFTITGMNHYLGQDFMEKGMEVLLEKEPDNEHDREAIQVKLEGLGKVGYAAVPGLSWGRATAQGVFMTRSARKPVGRSSICWTRASCAQWRQRTERRTTETEE